MLFTSSNILGWLNLYFVSINLLECLQMEMFDLKD